MEHEEITRTIIGCAMRVHRVLGYGFLESVYQKALAHELSKNDLQFQCERKIEVFYEDVRVGFFIADILVENCVVIENKAVQALDASHGVQLVNHLAATQIEVGLLLNFGADRLEYKRKYRTYRPARQQNAPD